MHYNAGQCVTAFQDNSNQANVSTRVRQGLMCDSYHDDSRRRHVRAYDVAQNGTLAMQIDRVLADLDGAESGVPDGMKVDVAGNVFCCVFFSSRRRHTRCGRDWSSDVCSSDLILNGLNVHYCQMDLKHSEGTLSKG